MNSLARLLACFVAVAAISSVSAADYYVADTGRTAHTEVSTSTAMSILGEDDHAHHHHDHDHSHDHASEDSSGPLIEMSVDQLYNAELEKAVVASGIDRLGMQNEGVEKTLRTFAEIQINAITGKTHYQGMDPVYLLLGMTYQNMSWARVPMIPVESPELAEAFGLDPRAHNRVSSVWVMKTPKARMMVMSKLQGMESPQAAALSNDAAKALGTFAFRLGTFLNLPGELKLVPMEGKQDVWLSPLYLERPELLGTIDANLARDVAAINKNSEPYKSMLALDNILKRTYNERQPQELAAATASFLEVAQQTPGYMTDLKRQMDYVQTSVHPFKRSGQLFMFAFFGFLVYLMTLRKSRKNIENSGDGSGGGLVDGRAEEYAALARGESGTATTTPLAREADAPESERSEARASLGEALKSLSPQPALAMSGAMGDAGTVTGGFENQPSGAGSKAFDNTGSSNYGDPISAALLETPKGSRWAWGLGFGFMIAATLTLVFALANRAYLGGRMPVSNMYESITFAMGAFAVFSVFYEAIHRRAWVGIGASFAGWVLMTMANSMSLQARKIDPLVAVLNSVWLNFHVTSLLISYSCFLLAFVTGILFLIKDMTGNRPGVLPRAETFEFLTYRCVQIGWPLLTLGIFLGAVWANTAWGSFWSWDPKETWALITWLTYTIYLHLRINLGWNGRKSIYASMIGFVMVLLTYFGVSYLPGLAGGMHSYAEPIKR